VHTRRRILEAAGQVFSTRGPFAATVEDVATAAGVGLATIYRHFGDKERLTLAFMNEMTPHSLIRSAALHPTHDVAADLDRIVDVMVSALTEHRDLVRLMFLAGGDDRAYLDRLREPTDSTLARLTAFFQVHLDAGRLDTVAHADELAQALMGMVLFATAIGPTAYSSAETDPRRTSDVIVEVFLRDLRGGRS
jgi:AcrR family transcriptional regulator